MQLAQLETCLTIFQFVLDQSFVFVLKLSTLRRFWSHNVFIHAVKTGLILTSAEFCSHSTFKSLEFTYLGSTQCLRALISALHRSRAPLSVEYAYFVLLF